MENKNNTDYSSSTSIEEKNFYQFKIRKDFYKNKKLILSIIIIISIIVGYFAISGFNQLPKKDDNGNIIYYTLNSNIYNNAEDYKGYYFNIKGKVFNVLGKDGDTNKVQVWADPENSELNLMIEYKTNDEIKNGDYISCTGYIAKITSFDNVYGTELNVPLLYSEDMKKSSYLEVVSPTIKEYQFDNLSIDQSGYKISIKKIEFAKKETRVYIEVNNKGSAELNIDTNALLIQNEKQYNTQTNYEADYDQVSYDIAKGVVETGILLYPPFDEKDFKIIIKAWSENHNEDLKNYEFNVKLLEKNDDTSTNQDNMMTDKNNDDNNKTLNSTNNNNSNNNTSSHESARIKAETIAKNDYPVGRDYVYDTLVNVDGYSSDDANYAISNANINWKNHALQYANNYQKDYFITPNDVKDDILSRGFTDDEAKYAINNCSVNWNERVVDYINKFLGNDFESKKDLKSTLQKHGYSSSQAEYGVNNCNINWSDIAKDYISGTLKGQNIFIYSECLDCGNFKGEHDACPECGNFVNTLVGYSLTREETVNKLLNAGFTQNEANTAVNALGDNYFYNSNNYK